MCIRSVYVYGLWMHACVFLCVCVPQLCRCTCLWLPTSGQQPLACNCKWMEPLWERKPIYCQWNSSINGQPLAGICHCLTLSGHFKLVLISHSQVWVLSEKLTQPVSPNKTQNQQKFLWCCNGHSFSTENREGCCSLWQYDKNTNKHFRMHQNRLYILSQGQKNS